MRRSIRPRLVSALVGLALVAAACGADQRVTDGDAAVGGDVVEADAPVVVVTTDVLGDVARIVLADTAAVVEVLIPSGADPHGYAPSAADGVALREASLVVAVGLGLEEALEDTLAAAEADGVDVVELAPLVDPIEYRAGVDPHDDHGDDDHDDDHDHGDDDHGDEDHGDEDHGDEDHGDDDHGDDDHGDDDHADEGAHVHEGLDPHVWLDPVRAGRLAEELAAAWAARVPADADVVTAAAAGYVAEMAALDEELAALVDGLPTDRRQLVTNHDALGYLAARYDLTVIGTVLPGTAADVDTDAAAFAALATLLRDTGVPAVFAETTSSDRLARALAEEVGDVAVVQLYTGALGPEGSGADTLAGMIRTDVQLIVDALG